MATAATTNYDDLPEEVQKMVGLSDSAKFSSTGIKHSIFLSDGFLER